MLTSKGSAVGDVAAGRDAAGGEAMRPWSAYLALTASMTLVGAYVALSRPLTLLLPLFALAFLRFCIGALAMLPWSTRRAGERPLTAHEKRLFFLMSFFGNFLFSICMLTGVSMTTATAAGVILSTLPAMVALFSRLLLGEQLGPRAVVAVALAILGIALLQWVKVDVQGAAPAAAPAAGAVDGAAFGDGPFYSGAVHGGRFGLGEQGRIWLGNALLLITVCCEAMYVVIGKRLSQVRAPLRVSALINLWGLVLCAPLGLWQLYVLGIDGLRAVPWGGWVLLVFYALSASLFSVWLWMTGLRHVQAHQAGVFTVALPIAATVIGVIFLGESFTLLHGAALLASVAGVVLITSARSA